MKIEGKVVAVLPMQKGNGRNGEWKSQTIVVDYKNGDYSYKLALTNMNDADSFAQLKVGDVCNFLCNPSSREYNGRWYTEVRCYNWEIVKPVVGYPVQNQQPQQQSQPQPQPTQQPSQSQSSDDLPF